LLRVTWHNNLKRASTKRLRKSHPALPSEGQVALTLREVCGLTTEEIARAFLVTPATLAQRIVRAKAVIRDKAIAYQVPVSQELSGKLGAVLQVV
jgi:RNA polymerase sigma-70 factor (ECF subfamily)